MIEEKRLAALAKDGLTRPRNHIYNGAAALNTLWVTS